jgi:carboxymethylenebutenolidase
MGKMIEIKADKVVNAYLATPATEPKGAIIVIHEVWGLVDHVKSVADRFAEAGFTALAPDLLEMTDILNAEEVAQLQHDLFDPEKRNEAQPQLRKIMAPMQAPEFGKLTNGRVEACFNYLYDQPENQQKVAITGFCFGGSYSFALAVNEPRLKISLPFYGHADQSVDELRNIHCPVRAFYGQNDERLMSQLPELTERMKEANVDFSAKVYPDCGHAFFNDTNSLTYNKAAADDAWSIVQRKLASVL